jgi:hypothetical protein
VETTARVLRGAVKNFCLRANCLDLICHLFYFMQRK